MAQRSTTTLEGVIAMHLSELKALHVSALIKMGEELEIENLSLIHI